MSRNLVYFVLLLCPALCMKLAGGQSGSDVWFSLNGTIYQNNSIVTLEDIGEGDVALLCKTDQRNCCTPAHIGMPDVYGNWLFPNETRVPSETTGNGTQWDFYRTRGQSVVRLNRRRGGEDGIYRCEIPDTANVIQTIYIGVYNTTGAPNVTELIFDRESRALTCTSTGGPATTVTWTKDGAVITPNTTHQQTQMIVDSVEGTYQNTLTIAQSVTGDNLYGLYSCMVENSRGSSNRTVYFYGAPDVTELTFDRESRTLTCTSTGGPATTVTWTKDGAVITPSTTHQQTQMIVDSVEGTYKNTLTIAQSVAGDNLYGLYSCMVENSRGSSNRTVYFYGNVWFSLNGTIYQNNSIVTLEDIGEGDDDDDALLCRTDITDCCGSPYTDNNNAIGNWFFPNGSRVPSAGSQWDFYRTRRQSVVLLHRRRGGADGIYRCEIPVPQSDAEDVNQTIFIGVYNTSTGVPNVTEPRTLTCTSTGGPATTVTWTKDGAVITPNTTHQQTQMIVDSVEGIYQNTLTIAQSVTGDNLYGLYSCAVENSRGSSNRKIYFYNSMCPVCISSISIPECTAVTCPSFPGTDDVMFPQLIPSPSPQATSSPSPQATSSPSSPETDSTIAPPTCSCSIEAIVITGVVAGVSGIAITLTVVAIVAVIRRRRTSYKLKDLNIRSHNPVFANITAIGMTDCPAYGRTTQHQHQQDDYEYLSLRPSASHQDEGHSLNKSQRDAYEN